MASKFTPVVAETLPKLYCREKLTTRQIAKKHRVAPSTIRSWLVKLDIPRIGRWDRFSVKPTKEQLEDLYIEQKLSTLKIGKLLNVNRSTVRRWLHEMSIPVRPIGNKMFKKPRILRGGYVYVYAPSHHRRNLDGYVCEHILVWEQMHQRHLPKGWIIHHINGIKTDNRPNNLLAMPTKRHSILIPKQQERIRELEAENRQLRRALEDSQMIGYFSEN